ncbi:MAG: 3-keto-5-aminohexanoate cleavage protein [Pseudomonas sp.]|uniref:3-keto-5-aminohexanoate cleavage protein n=1 Tax=Pseudomonas sp. TaxID=306 RepID=UPI003C750BCD
MAAKASKIIITCAITGSVHTPSMSPFLPITPDQIARASIEAAEAGASVVHLHARDPETGIPSQDPNLFEQFLPQIKQESDVVINLTTGGSPAMTIEERLQPVMRFKPEVASLNMGSMNFGTYELLQRFKEFKYDWEQPFLEASDERIFRNTFKDIAHILGTCAQNDTRFEIECYDIGHLYTAAHFRDRQLVKDPLFIQSVFGIRGGIGAHPEDVMHMKRTADRLFGDTYNWSVLGAGAHQSRIVTQSLLMGGHVRVGLEDNLWAGKGRLAQSNAEQVAAIKSVIESLGFSVATPDEAREIMGLKGRDNVAF